MSDRLRLGVAGLGRGFMLMLPTLAHHPKLTLAAAADPRPEARDQFAREFGARCTRPWPSYAPIPAWTRSTSPPRTGCTSNT